MSITQNESYDEQNTVLLPNFLAYGYQVVRELGHNVSGDRSTYLAIQISTEKSVVIKQFTFGRPGANWSGFKAYEREIQVLRSLNHPGIPQYLDCFETHNSFCLLQEYKNAQALSVPRSFTVDEIKQIAVSILEILVYLQNLTPPVTHRDIKPDNVLIDEQLNVYLVDFGLARIGSNDLAMNSVVVGTTGFMPPEQLLNQDLSSASDLYSLGATLICLLSGVKSASLNKFIDETFTINTEKLLHTSIEPSLKQWLKKMVAPRQSDRYQNATSAQTALEAIEQPSLLVDWFAPSNMRQEQEQDDEELTLVQTAHIAIKTSMQLGFYYTVLPLFPRVVFPVSKADNPFKEIIWEIIDVSTQFGSQLAYVLWNLAIIILLIKSCWDLVSERDCRSSSLAAAILGLSVLFFKFFASVLIDGMISSNF